MNSNILYEIHLASDVISSDIERFLTNFGFVRDAFIGGTTGVVHPCHYTIDATSASEANTVWQQCVHRLRKTEKTEFFGYGELEISGIGHRVDIPLKKFDPSVPFPVGRFEFEECPLEKHKAFDIHISVDLRSIDIRLKSMLEDTINFHYVDIRKTRDKVVRVYTIQPLGAKVTPSIFYILSDYFVNAGGFEGKIKLEMLEQFERFPCTAP